jgi:hypothetical protein
VTAIGTNGFAAGALPDARSCEAEISGVGSARPSNDTTDPAVKPTPLMVSVNVPAELAPRPRRREPDCVLDVAAQHLVVGHQPRQDRQAGGVCRRPCGRPKRIRVEIEDRARVGIPARCLRPGVVGT